MPNNTIVQLTRNIGTQEEPIKEKWYPVVLADAIKMNENDDAKTIVQWIMEQIGLLDQDSSLALETIKEIKDYIENHEDVSSAILSQLANKVDKEVGKGLSSNDFTDEEKEKLANLVLNTILYSNINPTIKELGGIKPGTTFDNMNITDILDMLLYPYILPSSDHLYYGTKCVDGIIGEKGVPMNMSLLPLTTTLIKNSFDIKSVHLIDYDMELCRVTENISNGGPVSFSLDPEEKIIVVNDTSLDIVIHDIQDGHTIIENNIYFVYPMYFGIVNNDTVLNGDIVQSLNKIISKKESKEFTVSSIDQKIVFAHPTGIGSLSSIKDVNGNELINVFDKHLINVQCADNTIQPYTLYVSYYSITLIDFKIKFIF